MGGGLPADWPSLSPTAAHRSGGGQQAGYAQELVQAARVATGSGVAASWLAEEKECVCVCDWWLDIWTSPTWSCRGLEGQFICWFSCLALRTYFLCGTLQHVHSPAQAVLTFTCTQCHSTLRSNRTGLPALGTPWTGGATGVACYKGKLVGVFTSHPRGIITGYSLKHGLDHSTPCNS